jgi:hypothetical protein
MTLESWAARLGYVVESQDALFFVHKETGPHISFSSEEGVVEFVIGEIRKDCCEGP